jgi:hypothetical protein
MVEAWFHAQQLLLLKSVLGSQLKINGSKKVPAGWWNTPFTMCSPFKALWILRHSLAQLWRTAAMLKKMQPIIMDGGKRVMIWVDRIAHWGPREVDRPGHFWSPDAGVWWQKCEEHTRNHWLFFLRSSWSTNKVDCLDMSGAMWEPLGALGFPPAWPSTHLSQKLSSWRHGRTYGRPRAWETYADDPW